MQINGTKYAKRTTRSVETQGKKYANTLNNMQINWAQYANKQVSSRVRNTPKLGRLGRTTDSHCSHRSHWLYFALDCVL